MRQVAAEDEIVQTRGGLPRAFDDFERGRREKTVAVQPQQEVVDEVAKTLARDDPEIVAVIGDAAARFVVPRRAGDAMVRGIRAGDDRRRRRRSNRRKDRHRGFVHVARLGQRAEYRQTSRSDRGTDHVGRRRVDDDQENFQRSTRVSGHITVSCRLTKCASGLIAGSRMPAASATVLVAISASARYRCQGPW